MKIFHGTIEIAGQMGILSGEQKKRGHLAAGYNIFHSYLGYKDHLVNTNPDEIQKTHKHIVNFFDQFHFHYATSLLPDYQDLEIIKHKGKKMIMHHWGNDIRFHDRARVHNPYVYTGDSPANEVIHHRLTRISRYVDEAIVQDYEVYAYAQPYYKKVHVVPISIDLTPIVPFYPKNDVKRPLILHAPTNPEFKGTMAIEAAIQELQKSYSFEYRRIQHLNHEEAIRLYREADLIVDQIRCGSYGLLSVEAMALGKPVIAYIRNDIVAQFPSQLPIMNANPDNVLTAIQSFLENPALRVERGLQGREYAEKYHAKEVVVDRLEQIYDNLPS
ncbi:glycosyltransferase [Paenibacillus sp.]|uniref:glycosyltransferase n=1 Tax=Paenibacillus sp. TaxID=58172 RepID=UPI00356926AF